MNVLVRFFFLSFLFVESPLAHEDRKSLIRDVGFFSFSLFDLQPEKFAHNLVLYVQGLGKLSALPVSGSWNSRSRTTSQSEYTTASVQLCFKCTFFDFWFLFVICFRFCAEIGSDIVDPETARRRSRAMSMEEYDIPNVRRLSLAKRDWKCNQSYIYFILRYLFQITISFLPLVRPSLKGKQYFFPWLQVSRVMLIHNGVVSGLSNLCS